MLNINTIFQKTKNFIGATYFPHKNCVCDVSNSSNSLNQINDLMRRVLCEAKTSYFSTCRREKVLSLISTTSLKFLESQKNSRIYLSTFIKELGDLIGADRIFLLKKNKVDGKLSILNDCIFEQPNSNISLFNNLGQFKNIGMKDKEYLRSTITNFYCNDDALELYFDKSIKQFCSAPIKVNESLMGIIVINNCSDLLKQWDNADLDILQIAANLIGAWWSKLSLDFKVFHYQGAVESNSLKTKMIFSYKDVFENLNFPTLICSTDNIIYDCNKSAVKLLQLNKEEIIGKSCVDFMSDTNCIEDSKQKAYSGKSCNFLTEMCLKGSTAICEVMVSIIPNTKDFICLLYNTKKIV